MMAVRIKGSSDELLGSAGHPIGLVTGHQNLVALPHRRRGSREKCTMKSYGWFLIGAPLIDFRGDDDSRYSGVGLPSEAGRCAHVRACLGPDVVVGRRETGAAPRSLSPREPSASRGRRLAGNLPSRLPAAKATATAGGAAGRGQLWQKRVGRQSPPLIGRRPVDLAAHNNEAVDQRLRHNG